MDLTVQTSNYEPENIYGSKDINAVEVIVLTGNKLKKGQLVKKDASGKIKADDGTAPADLFGIIADDVDATSADKKSLCFINGQFQNIGLTYPAGKAKADYADAFKKLGFIII